MPRTPIFQQLLGNRLLKAASLVRLPQIVAQDRTEKEGMADELHERIRLQEPGECDRRDHVEVDQPQSEAEDAATRDEGGRSSQHCCDFTKNHAVDDREHYMNDDAGGTCGEERVAGIECPA